MSFGGTKTQTAGGFEATTSFAAANVTASSIGGQKTAGAGRYPLSLATLRSALRDRRVDDALAGLIKAHLSSPLAKPTGTAPAGSGTVQPAAFENAAHERTIHDLTCLIVLFTASVSDVEGLGNVLASIVASVTANLAQYIGCIPSASTSSSQFIKSPAEERLIARQHAITLSATELLLLILNEWQIDEQGLKELLAAVTNRISNMAQHRPTGFATAGTVQAASSSNVILYMLCTATIAALNVWGALRRSSLSTGPNALCVPATAAPIVKHLLEWLERLQSTLKQHDDDTTRTSAPVAGQFLSMFALAVGCFVFRSGDDVGLDVALAAIQGHRRISASHHHHHHGAAHTHQSVHLPVRHTSHHHHHPPSAYGGVDAIAGYGKALKCFTKYLPPSESLTVPRSVPAMVVFRLVRFVVVRMGTTLVRHLAELDVNAYRAMALYASFTAKHLSRGSLSRDVRPLPAAMQASSAGPLPAPVEARFYIPQLLDCISGLLDELPDAVDLLHDEPCPFLSATGEEDFDPAAPPSSIMHLLTQNLPLHFRNLFEVRRSVTVSSSAVTLTLDAACFKQLGKYLSCLSRVLESNEDRCTAALTALADQVECPELRMESLSSMMRECVGLPPVRTAPMLSQHHHINHLHPAAAAEHDRVSLLKNLSSITSLRQLSVSYLDKQRAVFVAGCAKFFAAVAPYHTSIVTPNTTLTAEQLFEVLTAPDMQQEAAGEVLRLIATTITSPMAASLALRLLDDYGLLLLPKAGSSPSPRPSAVHDTTSPPSGLDLSATLRQEARVALYPVTIGFLRLVCAVVAYPLPAEALPLVDFVAQSIFCGFSRRTYSVEKQKYLIGALGSCALQRLLCPAAWICGVVPYARIMVPAQAPSDVLGDCISVVLAAAADVHQSLGRITPLRYICIREVIGLISKAVHAPQPMPWLSIVTEGAAAGMAAANSTLVVPAETASPVHSEKNHSSHISSSLSPQSFAIVARTRESSDFVAALVRLVLLDDAVGASMALELARDLLPSSSASVVRDVARADPAAAAQVVAAFAHVLAPEDDASIAPIPLTHDVRGTPGVIGPNRIASPRETGDRAGGKSAADRLRHAAVELLIKSAASRTPALVMWLCGYSGGTTMSREVGDALPAWMRAAAGVGLTPPLASEHVLDAVLSFLNNPRFAESHTLLGAAYTKFLVLLFANPMTNTEALRSYLQMRDGLDFLGCAFTTMGLPAELAASIDDPSVGVPRGPEAVFKAAYCVKLMTYQFFDAAQRLKAGASASVGDGDRLAQTELVARYLSWLFAAPANAALPPLLSNALNESRSRLVLCTWLVAGITSAPPCPSLPPILSPDGADLAALCLVCHPTADKVPGPTDTSLSLFQETLAPQYDIAAIYSLLRETDSRASSYGAERWREILGPYIEANECARAQHMISVYVDCWSEFVELMCGCFWESIPTRVWIELARFLYATADAVHEAFIFLHGVESSILESLYRAIVAALGALRRAVSSESQDTDAEHPSARLDFNVDSASDLLSRCVRGVVHHAETNDSAALKYNACVSLLCLLRSAKVANVPVDETGLLGYAETLFSRLTQAAASGPPTSRITALRTLSATMEGRPDVVMAMISPRRSGGGPSAVRHFVSTALANVTSVVAAALSQTAAPDDPVYAAEWIEALLGYLFIVGAEAPHMLESTDLLRQIAECEVWGVLTAVLLAEIHHAEGRAGNVMSSSTAGADGPGRLQVALALRALAAVTNLLASLLDKLLQHQTAPQDAAAFVQNNIMLFAHVFGPRFVELAAAESDARPPRVPPLEQPSRLLAAAAHLFMSLSATPLCRGMETLGAKVDVLRFFAALIDSIGGLCGTNPAEIASRATDSPQKSPDIDGESSPAAQLFCLALSCTATFLLNIVLPPPSLGGTRRRGLEGGGEVDGADLNDLAPHGKGREVLVRTLVTHATVADRLSHHATHEDEGHRRVLAAVSSSAQITAVILHTSILRMRQRAGNLSRGGGGDLSPVEKQSIGDATSALVRSTAAAARRIFESPTTTNHDDRERQGLSPEQSVFIGHIDSDSPAHSAAASARATQAILGSLLRAASS